MNENLESNPVVVMSRKGVPHFCNCTVKLSLFCVKGPCIEQVFEAKLLDIIFYNVFNIEFRFTFLKQACRITKKTCTN